MRDISFYSLMQILPGIIFILASCAPLPPPPPLVLTPERDRPAIKDDMGLDSLRQAALNSLNYLERLPVTQSFSLGRDSYSREEMIESIQLLIELIDISNTPEDFVSLVRQNFSFYQSTGLDGKGEVLFTGYYLPVLKGSRICKGEYIYPLYTQPDDMVYINLQDFGIDYPQKTLVGRLCRRRLVPYYTRREIDCQGVLRGRGLELLYLSDPIDAFFLQIQGSGLIELEDGGSVFVQYQAANGYPYRSIGRLLVDEGKMDFAQVSLTSLKDYLKQHPEEQERILSYNKSYVFFRLSPKGPYGASGEILTPGRSIATDSRIFPKGGIALIITEKPVLDGEGKIERWIPFTRLVLNQDTGGAIKGPGRVDIFWGSGLYAKTAAGNFKQKGSLFFLVKKRKTIDLDR